MADVTSPQDGMVFEDGLNSSNHASGSRGWNDIFWLCIERFGTLTSRDFQPGLDDKTTIVLPNGLTIQKPSEDHQEIFCNSVRFVFTMVKCKCLYTNDDEKESKEILEWEKTKPTREDCTSQDDYRQKTVEWSWEMLHRIFMLQEVVGFGTVRKQSDTKWK